MSQPPVSRPEPLRGEIVSEGGPAPPNVVSILDFVSYLMDRLVQVPGSHKLCFTNPKALAQAIMDAGRD